MACKLLYPFAWLYKLLTSARNKLYDSGVLRSSAFDIPVINVGNLSAGGNGKTPMTEYIANMLAGDYRIAVLSRGYGRKSKGFREVSPGQTAEECGDEPLQIKRNFGDKIKVFVGENRVEAVTKILFKYPEIQLIILDDAFQHRALQPGLNLLLTSFDSLFIDDKLLPAGRLRESPKGAARADVIIVTKCPADLSEKQKKSIAKRFFVFGKPVLFSFLKYGEIQQLINGGDSSHKSYLMVTAIAKPALMEKRVREKYEILDVINFADHHDFTERDIKNIERKISIFAGRNPEVLTTSKDAVRFGDFYKRRKFDFGVNVLPVTTDFFGEDKMIFTKILKDYVRESTANG